VCNKADYSSALDLPLQFVCSAVCFITDSFYTSELSPQTYHPCLRPHLRHVLHALQGRVPYNMSYYNKKPQGCQSWGPLEFSVFYYYTLVSLDPLLSSGVRSSLDILIADHEQGVKP